MALNVLLVEDDIDLAQSVIDYFDLASIDSDHASNGFSALALAGNNVYQAIILDLNLPRVDGIQVCQTLRNKGVDTPILMLSARDSMGDKEAGFLAGTDDYLVKPFNMQELVLRVRALSRRKSGQAKKLTVGGLTLHLDAKQAERHGQLLSLSPTGLKILELLMRSSPAPVSRNALIDSVWAGEPPDTNTLKVHIHKLRKAIDSGFDMPLLKTLHGIGFSLSE